MVMPNVYALLAGIIAFVGATVGAYFYGEHQQKSADTVQAQALQLAQDKALADAKAQAAATTAALQASADERAATIQKQLDDVTGRYADAIKQSKLALSKLPHCPIPVTD